MLICRAMLNLCAAGLLASVVGCGAPNAEETGRASRDRHPVGGKADGTGCAGHCGTQAPSGCWCDKSCAQHNDCCADKVQVCDNKQPSCAGACGARSPDGCWCDAQCASYGDCCPDHTAECAAQAKTYGFPEGVKRAALGNSTRTVDQSLNGECGKYMKTYKNLQCAGWVAISTAGGKTRVALGVTPHTDWYQKYQNKYQSLGPNAIPSSSTFWSQHVELKLDVDGKASYQRVVYEENTLGPVQVIKTRYDYEVAATEGAIRVGYLLRGPPNPCGKYSSTCDFTVLAPPTP